MTTGIKCIQCDCTYDLQKYPFDKLFPTPIEQYECKCCHQVYYRFKPHDENTPICEASCQHGMWPVDVKLDWMSVCAVLEDVIRSKKRAT